MFVGRRGGAVVAGGMLYRADGVVGLSNVVADADYEPAVWRDLALLAAATFPGSAAGRLRIRATSSKPRTSAGFEIGDPLRVWVMGGLDFQLGARHSRAVFS